MYCDNLQWLTNNITKMLNFLTEDYEQIKICLATAKSLKGYKTAGES